MLLIQILPVKQEHAVRLAWDTDLKIDGSSSPALRALDCISMLCSFCSLDKGTIVYTLHWKTSRIPIIGGFTFPR